MRKINILMLLLLVAVLVLASCSPKQNVVQDEKAASLPPSDNILKIDSLDDKVNFRAVPNIDTNYIKLDDINPDAVHEIKLGFQADTYRATIAETGDGFLYGDIVSPLQTSSKFDYKQNSTPRIKKIDEKGNLVWEKEYDYKTYTGRINNIVVFPEGSFAFSVQCNPYYNGSASIFEKSFIIKCDKDGNELWKKDFQDYTGGLLRNLFINKDNDLIAVGQWRIKDGEQTIDGAADDIVITKLGKDGNILKQKGFGGGDFDSLNISKYDGSLGILINGRSQSKDGDFAIKESRFSDFIACIDDNLNLKWVSFAGKDESYIYDQVEIYQDFVYVLGSHNKGGGAPVEGFLLKFDSKGKKLWQKSALYLGFWGNTVSVLKSGDIVVSSGQQNQGIIMVLDQSGLEKKRIEGLKYSPSSIVPTEDGGFIVTANREIKTVPQPLYVSSIWYDTELVAEKYKTDYMVEWRKTYDSYKDAMGRDLVFPFKDGRLIIE